MRVTHKREVEGGEYGTVLSTWPYCETGDGEPRYPHGVRMAREWDKVTCKLCLKKHRRRITKVAVPPGSAPHE
jgi:hypothetical protein